MSTPTKPGLDTEVLMIDGDAMEGFDKMVKALGPWVDAGLGFLMTH